MDIRNNRGFSAFELLIVLGIISIVGMSAVPASRAMKASVERGEALNQLEFDLRRIRTEAVAAGLLSVFQISNDGKSYTAGFDLLPYASPPQIEEVVFGNDLPNTITVTADQGIYFDSRGFLINDTSDPTTSEVTILSDGNPYAQIFVTPTGALDVYN